MQASASNLVASLSPTAAPAAAVEPSTREDFRNLAGAYHQADLDFRLQESRVGFILVLVCVPLGVALDALVYPDLWRPLLVSRVVCDLVAAPLFAILFARWGRRWVNALGLVWPLLPVVTIAWMIYAAEGVASPYYAGLNLVLLAACLLMPYTLVEALGLCLATIGVYLLACWAHVPGAWRPVPPYPPQPGVLFNNVYFLTITSLVCVTACFFNTRRRMKEFALRRALGQSNGQLAASYEQLAQLDRLKSEFFANISHELRTPLTLIVSPLEQLLSRHAASNGVGAGPSESLDLLTIARQNALRLLRLINDLLEMVRLEEGKARLEFEPMELGRFAAAMADSVRHLATTKGLKLETSGDEGLVVAADPGRLEKVVLNVLTNAIKFTPPGGTIAVTWRRAGDRAAVEFADTGTGIPEAQLPFIFERFRQADGSSTRKYHGVGIGLALAKDLVREHGGTLSASSRVGAGTVIRMELPLGLNVASRALPAPHRPAGDLAMDPIARIHYDAERTLPGEEGPAVDPAAVVGQGEHSVLVVDDEPDMRRFLVAALAERYRVFQAADGPAGLEAVRRSKPDLVLLDLMLPGLDGLDVCQAIRADADAGVARTKVVLLTARTDEASKITALERGADDFLTKPFSLAEVRTRLANLLKAATLEEQVVARNLELQGALDKLQAAEVQLVHSEKMNALGKLSAGLMHEIGNPLNFTLTAVQIARDTTPESEADLHDTLKDIEEGMTRIRDIVSDLKTFAYPTKNGRLERLDVTDVVKTALHLTAHELRDASVDRADVDPGPILGNKTQLTHVLVNLLVNSAEAVRRAAGGGNAGGRKPTIRVRARPDGGRMRVSVWDNGEGIRPEDLPKVFDPFFTTRDVGKGMGLGLSICHTIVSNHGGRMAAASEAGHWAEVSFDLALAEGAGRGSVEAAGDHPTPVLAHETV
jgi:signal transduction histidine kinase